MSIPPKPKCDSGIKIKCLALFSARATRLCWLIRPSHKLHQACGERGVSLHSKLDWIGTIAHDGEIRVESSKLQVESQESGVGQPPNLETFNHEPNPLLRLIGQIGATYLVAESPDGLYLIDQHARTNACCFEKLMAQHDQKKIPSQSADTRGRYAFRRNLQKHWNLNYRFSVNSVFEVEEFGANTFQVRAMPSLFAGSDPSAALRAIVEDFEEDESPLQNEIEKKLAARVCKRMAVKGGQTLSPEEQRALLSIWKRCDSPRTCPHGRPTMISSFGGKCSTAIRSQGRTLMPVDYQQVHTRIKEIGAAPKERSKKIKRKTFSTRDLLSRYASELDFLRAKVDSAKAVDANIRCAYPVNEVTRFALPR